jgi:CO/xanthine dehydrogenase Mo-binding subunit
VEIIVDGNVCQIAGEPDRPLLWALRDGLGLTGNFDRYPLTRVSEAPELETILPEAPDGKPWGPGEPPLVPIASVTGNASLS